MKIMYILAHRLHDVKAWKRVRLVEKTDALESIRWSSIRYGLEHLMCRIKEKTRNPSAPLKKVYPAKPSAYIEAFFYKGPEQPYSKFEVPADWCFFKDETVWLVLRLHPMPIGFNAHVPCELDEAVEAADDHEKEQNAKLALKLSADMDVEQDELKRILLIAKCEGEYVQEGTAYSKARKYQQLSVLGLHPSEFVYEERAEDVDADARVVRREPVPPETFHCPACDAAGEHFRAYCPILRTTKFLAGDDAADAPERVAPLDRLALLKGVPATFRAIVAPGESKTITADGDAVTVIKRTITRMDHLPVYSMLLSTGDGSTAESIRAYEETCPAMTVPDPKGAQLDFEPHLVSLESRLKDLERRFYRDNPQLERKGPQCLHFLKGMCHKGYLACEFSHNLCAKKPVCAFFAENKCKAGEKCEFIHPDRIEDHMIRPDKTNGLAPSASKNKAAVTAAKEKRALPSASAAPNKRTRLT